MERQFIRTKDGRMFYIGRDTTSDLQHWKYIKKERKNGKWRYYYRDDELENKIYEANKASQDARETADSLYRQAMDKLKKVDSIEKDLLDAIATEKDLYAKLDTNAKLGNLNADNAMTKIAYGNAVERRRELERQSAYMRSLIRKDIEASSEFDEESVKLEYDAKDYQKEFDKAFGHKVVDVLNSTSDNINKAKSWVTNLFKSKH